jgi:excisionase family DNA binding protein
MSKRRHPVAPWPTAPTNSENANCFGYIPAWAQISIGSGTNTGLGSSTLTSRSIAPISSENVQHLVTGAASRILPEKPQSARNQTNAILPFRDDSFNPQASADQPSESQASAQSSDSLMTAAEVAAMLAVSLKTARRLISRGEFLTPHSIPAWAREAISCAHEASLKDDVTTASAQGKRLRTSSPPRNLHGIQSASTLALYRTEPLSGSPEQSRTGSDTRPAITPRHPLLTIDDVATFLSVSTKTVRRMIGRGELPHIRVGRQVRIRWEALENNFYDRSK